MRKIVRFFISNKKFLFDILLQADFQDLIKNLSLGIFWIKARLIKISSLELFNNHQSLRFELQVKNLFER